MAVKQILYATDYSEASRFALPIATRLARQAVAPLLIAHVSDRELYPVRELFDAELKPDEEELQKLNAIVPIDRQAECEHRLLYGKPGSTDTVRPADAILALAEKERPEAIVIGTHEQSGLADLLMGSVAQSVVRHAYCPVITVAQPHAE